MRRKLVSSLYFSISPTLLKYDMLRGIPLIDASSTSPKWIDMSEGKQKATDQSGCLIEQYKCYVGTTDSTSDRRLSTNTFFLTLHTGVLLAAGYSILVYPSVVASALAVGAAIMLSLIHISEPTRPY